MSERKVLTKYYPPDFDPSKIVRAKGSKLKSHKLPTVTLMAPFSMRCTTCGEYIYKGRKFNARKETTDMKYLTVTIFRFYIKCTQCRAEITFRTDPKNMDYECEKGATRNFEIWRESKLAEETEEERLNRLEREEEEKDAMKDLEKKTIDAKTEMQIADALDEIRMRNARNERAEKEGDSSSAIVGRILNGNDMMIDAERERQDREDEEAARNAFMTATGEKIKRIVDDEDVLNSPEDEAQSSSIEAVTNHIKANPEVEQPLFKRMIKKKKDFGAALGIKKKPSLV